MSALGRTTYPYKSTKCKIGVMVRVCVLQNAMLCCLYYYYKIGVR